MRFFWCVMNRYLLILGPIFMNVSRIRQLELWVNLKPETYKVIEEELGFSLKPGDGKS